MAVSLYIEGELLDQYSDESVDVVSSVLDVSDITKNTGDYSKTFNIPTSKRNNLILKHWYNASIDGGFDARTKAKGHIEIDGVPFKTGKWLLHKVKIFKGEATSYTINFFGNTASIKDRIKGSVLSELDLSHLDHEYNSTNVKLGLQGQDGLFNKSIVYTPMASRQYFYNSNESAGDFSEQIVNIADNNNFSGEEYGSGIKWSDLRPSVKLLEVIEAVETKFSSGIHQTTIINILEPNTNGIGQIVLTIEDTPYVIDVNTLTVIENAQEIADYVNANITDYTATLLGSSIIIEADNEGAHTDSTLDPATATGLVFTIVTSKKGTTETPIKFSRDFFGTSEFNKLYMWLNPNEDSKPIGGGKKLIDWDTLISGSGGGIGPNPMDFNTDIANCYLLGGATVEWWAIRIQITPIELDIPYTIHLIDEVNNWEVSKHFSEGGFVVWNTASMRREDGLPFSSNIKIYIEANEPITFEPTLELKYIYNGLPYSLWVMSGPQQDSASDIVMSDIMPVDLSIMEFLKGLFQMFKLVVVGQSNGVLYINTLDSYYSQGNRYDITNYIDFKSYDVNRGEILSQIDFKYQDPETVIAEEFKKNNGVGYGDSNVKLFDDKGSLLDGDSLEVELPFEMIVYDRLIDQNDPSNTTFLQVGQVVDYEREPVFNKPHIHYVDYIDISPSPVKFTDHLGVASTLNTKMWVPFQHFGVTNPIYSLFFESEISTFNNEVVENTLYSRHYQDYITSIFNLKRRTLKYEAILPIQIVTRLDLNDVVSINNLDYRINKFTYNLLTGKTKLELINGFNTRLNGGVYIPKVITVSRAAQDLDFNIPDVSTYTITKVDIGDGTGWLDVAIDNGDNNNIVTFSLSQGVNNSIDYRSMNVDITRDGITTTVLISQETYINTIRKPIYTVDNTEIKSDNTNITSDNG